MLDSSEKHELNIQLNEKLFHHYGKSRTSYLLNIAEGLALHPQKKVSVIKGGIVYSSWNTTISMTKEDQWRSIQNTGLEWKRGGENARKILCTRLLLFLLLFCFKTVWIYTYSSQQCQATWKCFSAHYKLFYNSTNLKNCAAWGACYCFICRLEKDSRMRSCRQVERMTRGLEMLLSEEWLQETEIFKLKKGHLNGRCDMTEL